MSNLNAAQYEAAATAYFTNDHQGKLNFQKYFTPTLLAAVVQEMQSSLPSVVAARLSFERLVANGRLQRTDGKDEVFDRAEAVKAARANIDAVVAEIDSAPLSRSEIEYFASLSQRELSQLYYGDDGTAVNDFAIRYRRAVREYGYAIPGKFGNQEVVEQGEIELTTAQYNAMSASDLQQKLRNPKWKAAVYRLLAEHKI